MLAAAFPSACGKTNLAMLQPNNPGWTVETLGDDIAWMRFGADGRLYTYNSAAPVRVAAPGHQLDAMRTVAKGNSVFTNVALTERRHVSDEPPAHLTDWKGNDWTPESGELSSHPKQPVLHADHPVPDPSPASSTSPAGVPVSAIVLWRSPSRFFFFS